MGYQFKEQNKWQIINQQRKEFVKARLVAFAIVIMPRLHATPYAVFAL